MKKIILGFILISSIAFGSNMIDVSDFLKGKVESIGALSRDSLEFESNGDVSVSYKKWKSEKTVMKHWKGILDELKKDYKEYYYVDHMNNFKDGHTLKILSFEGYEEIWIYPVGLGTIEITSQRFSSKEDIDNAMYLTKEAIKMLEKQ